MKSKVALTKSGKRVENIEAALRLIKSEIDLETKSDVFIKVNLVSTRNQLAATHVDSVRALLRNASDDNCVVKVRARVPLPYSIRLSTYCNPGVY